MRRIVVANIISVDGYYEGPGRDVMTMPMGPAFDEFNLLHLEAAGAVLLGRRSFELFSSYWPGIASAPDDPDDPELSDVNRAVSSRFNAVAKTVVGGVVPLAGNPWADTTTGLSPDRLEEGLSALRAGVPGDAGDRGELLGSDTIDSTHAVLRYRGHS